MKNIAVTLSIIITSALLFNACRNKSIEPEEYFSFYADGEYFNIPQESRWSFGGEVKSLKAYKVGLTSYSIRATVKDFPHTSVSLEFSGGHIPDEDTVIIYSAGISHLKKDENNYEILPPLTGRVIFTERSSSKLTGAFEFEAYKYNYDSDDHVIYTDTIIKITNGKFSIIPTN